MTLTFNRAAYANLLVDVLPQPIRSQAEYDRVLGIIEASMNKETVSVEVHRDSKNRRNLIG
jgi:hypothetical protein